jgi:hypothetical protein
MSQCDPIPIEPHDYQCEGICRALDGDDVVATMATGAGKTGLLSFLMLVVRAISRNSSLVERREHISKWSILFPVCRASFTRGNRGGFGSVVRGMLQGCLEAKGSIKGRVNGKTTGISGVRRRNGETSLIYWGSWQGIEAERAEAHGERARSA